MYKNKGDTSTMSGDAIRFKGSGLLKRFRQVGILIALLIIVGVFTSLTPIFLTPSNLINIFVQSTITSIIGIGMTLVIISAGIDLSVGPLVALVIVVVATQMVNGIPVPIAIVIGLAIGIVAGIFNGVMIAHVGLQPFIVTLGYHESFSWYGASIY